MPWKTSFQLNHAEAMIDATRDMVAALRARGLKTPDCIRDLACRFKVAGERRLRTFFHRDGEPVVDRHEAATFCERAAAFWHRQAEWHRQQEELARERARKLMEYRDGLVDGVDRRGAADRLALDMPPHVNDDRQFVLRLEVA